MRITNAKQFGRVGLVVGGDSGEREVSLQGGQAVAAALQRKQVEVKVFDGAVALLRAVAAKQIDRVFNLLHGPGGEDGTLQGALELYGIPVTGSGVLGSALTMDKVRSKRLLMQSGLNTPAFVLARQGEPLEPAQLTHLGLPLFVKPVGQGSSLGVSKVNASAELPAALDAAFNYGSIALIEQAIVGDEYFAGVVHDRALPLIRVHTANEFYDYEAKYLSDDTEYFCPCGLEETVEQKLRQQALKAFNALGASGWGRVDFLLDSQQQAWFLEVNTTPGMTNHSLVPQAAAQIGIDFDGLVWRILETSL